VLRLRDLVIGGALACAGAVVTIALFAELEFAYRDPALHVALETTASITALAAAFLLLGRFQRFGFLDELILSAGLSLLALSNLVYSAVPGFSAFELNRASVWGWLFTGTLAALLICLAALLPRRRIAGGVLVPLAVYISAFALAAVGALLIVEHQQRLPQPVTSSFPPGASHAQVVGHPAFLATQISLALLYILAAYGFTRRHRLASDELSGWLAVACVLSAAAHLTYLLYPPLHPTWVYTGDVFRLGIYVVLLIGAAREIASYWASAASAAALEERRQIARDVHDGLAQEIAFIGRNVQALRWKDADPELVDRIMEGVRRAELESRQVVGALSPSTDEPFELTLARAAREAAERYGAAVDMELVSGITLPPRKREAVVRIASEAVTNAARHSGAEHLHVALERAAQGIRLRVADDGVGFDAETRTGPGFGLITMRDRAESFGGRLQIRSRRGQGTEVEVEL
jgi:signal transduction histidine kinase